MTHLPEALRLADALETLSPLERDAAAELRRLHDLESVFERQCKTLRRMVDNNDKMIRALERISRAQPHGLDHRIDMEIIQRCAKVARAAIAAAKEQA